MNKAQLFLKQVKDGWKDANNVGPKCEQLVRDIARQQKRKQTVNSAVELSLVQKSLAAVEEDHTATTS